MLGRHSERAIDVPDSALKPSSAYGKLHSSSQDMKTVVIDMETKQDSDAELPNLITTEKNIAKFGVKVLPDDVVNILKKSSNSLISSEDDPSDTINNENESKTDSEMDAPAGKNVLSTVKVSHPIVEVHALKKNSGKNFNVPKTLPRTSFEIAGHSDKDKNGSVLVSIEEAGSASNEYNNHDLTSIQSEHVAESNQQDSKECTNWEKKTKTDSSDRTSELSSENEEVEALNFHCTLMSCEQSDSSPRNQHIDNLSTDVNVVREHLPGTTTLEIGATPIPMFTDDEVSRPTNEMEFDSENTMLFPLQNTNTNLLTDIPRTDDEKQSARRNYRFDYGGMRNFALDPSALAESPEHDENKIRMDADASLHANDASLDTLSRTTFSREIPLDIFNEEGYSVGVSSKSLSSHIGPIDSNDAVEFDLFRNKTDQVKDEEHLSINVVGHQLDTETVIDDPRSKNKDLEDGAAKINSMIEIATNSPADELIERNKNNRHIEAQQSSIKKPTSRVSSPNDRSNIFGMYVNHDFNTDNPEREIGNDSTNTGTKPKYSDSANKPIILEKQLLSDSPQSNESFVSAKKFFMAKSEVKLLSEVPKERPLSDIPEKINTLVSNFDIKLNNEQDEANSLEIKPRKISQLNFELSKPVNPTLAVKLRRAEDETENLIGEFHSGVQISPQETARGSQSQPHVMMLPMESDLPEVDSDLKKIADRDSNFHYITEILKQDVDSSISQKVQSSISDETDESFDNGFGVAFGFKGFKKRIGKVETLGDAEKIASVSQSSFPANDNNFGKIVVGRIPVSVLNKSFERLARSADEEQLLKGENPPESEATVSRPFEAGIAFSEIDSSFNLKEYNISRSPNDEQDDVANRGTSAKAFDISNKLRKITKKFDYTPNFSDTEDETDYLVSERLSVVSDSKNEDELDQKHKVKDCSFRVTDEESNSQYKDISTNEEIEAVSEVWMNASKADIGKYAGLSFDEMTRDYYDLQDENLSAVSSEEIMSLAATAAIANRRKKQTTSIFNPTLKEEGAEGKCHLDPSVISDVQEENFDKNIRVNTEKSEQIEPSDMHDVNSVSFTAPVYPEIPALCHKDDLDYDEKFVMNVKNGNKVIVKELKLKDNLRDEVKVNVGTHLKPSGQITNTDHVVCIQSIQSDNVNINAEKNKSEVTVSNMRRSLTDSEELKRKAASLDDLSQIPNCQDDSNLERAVSLEFRSNNESDSSINLHKHRINLPNSSATSIDEEAENFSQASLFDRNSSGLKKSAMWGTLEDAILPRHHASNDSLSIVNGNSVSIQTHRRRDYRASSLEGLPSSVLRSNSTKLTVDAPNVTVRSNPSLSMSNTEVAPTNLEINFNSKIEQKMDTSGGGPISNIEISGDHGISITSVSHSKWDPEDERIHQKTIVPSLASQIYTSKPSIMDISGATTIRVIENHPDVDSAGVLVVENEFDRDLISKTNSVLLNSNYLNDPNSEVTVTTVSGSGKTSFLTGSPPSPPELVSPLTMPTKHDWIYTNGDTFDVSDHSIHRGSSGYAERELMKNVNSRIISSDRNDQTMMQLKSLIHVDGNSSEDNRSSRTFVIPPAGTSAAISITQSESPPPFLQPPY